MPMTTSSPTDLPPPHRRQSPSAQKAAAAAVTTTAAATPLVRGRYRPLRLLRETLFGAVYLCEDTWGADAHSHSHSRSRPLPSPDAVEHAPVPQQRQQQLRRRRRQRRRLVVLKHVDLAVAAQLLKRGDGGSSNGDDDGDDDDNHSVKAVKAAEAAARAAADDGDDGDNSRASGSADDCEMLPPAFAAAAASVATAGSGDAADAATAAAERHPSQQQQQHEERRDARGVRDEQDGRGEVRESGRGGGGGQQEAAADCEAVPQTLDDPRQERATAQLLRRAGGHPNVVRYLDAFVDDAGGDDGDCAGTSTSSSSTSSSGLCNGNSDGSDSDSSLFFVLEYCADSDLHEYLLARHGPGGRLSPVDAMSVLAQVAAGVAFVHALGLAHRDISLENVLLDRGVCKLSDFGLSASASQPRAERVGKAYYMAPEVVTASAAAPYDARAADVWSLGITFFILLTGSPLVPLASRADRAFAAFARHGVRAVLKAWGRDEALPPCVTQLLEGMLAVDPSSRLTIQQVLRHRAFDEWEASFAAHEAAGEEEASPCVSPPPSVPSTSARAHADGGDAENDEEENDGQLRHAQAEQAEAAAEARWQWQKCRHGDAKKRCGGSSGPLAAAATSAP